MFNEEEYHYTLEPPPLGSDPVDRFLFETQRGFCEHYAGSFALLMRLAGIPSRVVVGYQGGERNPHANHWVIRQSDAAEAAKALLALFRTPSTETPAFRFGQPDTRFLGIYSRHGIELALPVGLLGVFFGWLRESRGGLAAPVEPYYAQLLMAMADDLRVIRFPSGRYENYWTANVVAIGNAPTAAIPRMPRAARSCRCCCCWARRFSPGRMPMTSIG